jgi:tetratricopeptide (TPR) repeat protein
MPTPQPNASAAKRWLFPLPWVVGAIAFLVYSLTLNHWASLSGIGAIARVSGWAWQPELRQPLNCAVLYLLRCLPAAWLPSTLNLFTAICAALVITLLARSVSLLHGAVGRASWAPACIAVAICGLQLSFWEHATGFSGEMIDLLIFAYVIRCLLEFQNDQCESWLSRSAFVYAAGMANNWAMLGYFPLFVFAILLLKGFGFKRVTRPSPPRRPRPRPLWLRRAFAKIGIRQNAMPKPVYAPFRPVVFDTRFFLQMTLWGLVGLSFYLLLPLVQSLSPDSSIGFWPALKANLTFQKNLLVALRSPAFRILAIASLLPILVLVIGWKSHPANSGYETRRGIFLNRLAAHPLHAFVLLITLWLSFDPIFSPRHLGVGVPMLTYYYLAAIMAGYCAGYFLRIGQEGASKAFAKFASGTICTLAVVLPLLLTARNLGQILLTNGPSIHQFARELYEDLPGGKSVVFGNDFVQLTLLRAELAAQHYAKDALVVEMPALGSAQYHIFMARKYGSRWPVLPPTNAVDLVGPIKLLKLLSVFAEHQAVAYFDPTFGPLFDRPSDSVTGFLHHFDAKPEPRESSQEVAQVALRPENETLWQRRWSTHAQSLADYTKAQPRYSPQWLRPLLSTLRLQAEPNATAFYLSAIYSKSLNNWGVQSQRLGHWAEAGAWFQHSLNLNPENLCAYINSEYNEHWQRGEKARLNPSLVQKQFAEIFGRRNDWREILSDFGPVDEPTFLFRTGRAFLANGNTRLAASAFQRSADLAPDWPPPKLWLAQGLIAQGNFAEALKVTENIQSTSPPQEGAGLAQLLARRVTSLRGLGRTNEVAPCIDGFAREHGKHREVLAAAADAYAQSGLHEQQLATLNELLKREPNRPEWLSKKGLAELQLGHYDAAIATFTIVLSLMPTDENARLSRAIARLGADQLDAAREDYQALLTSSTNSANALYGLGAVAWRKHDTNAAIGFYQRYLSNAAPGSAQMKVATERLRALGTR